MNIRQKLAMKSIAGVAAVLIALLALVCSLGILGHCAWPPLHWDANLYVTPAINRAAGKGDTFAAYGLWLLRQDDTRFQFHGQLYQAVVGVMLPAGDFVSLMRAAGALNALSVALCAAFFFCHARVKLHASVLVALCWALLGAAATAAVLLYIQGRPEQLLPLLLALAGLLHLPLSEESDWYAIANGATAGVVAATSPLPGLILLNAYVLREATRASQPRWFQRSAFIGLAAAGAWFAVITITCPYSPMVILTNTVAFAGRETPRRLRTIPEWWLLSEHFPLIGVVYALFVASFLPQLASLRRQSAVRIGIAALLLLSFAKWTSEAGLRWPVVLYNLICFFPVVFVQVLDRSYAYSVRFGRSALAPVGVCALAVAMGFFHKMALLPSYSEHGLSLANARTLAQQYIGQLSSQSRIAIHAGRPPALVVLSDDNWSLVAIDFSLNEVARLEKKFNIRFEYFFYSQHDDDVPPPTFGPFALRDNYYVSGRPRFLGVELGRTMPGYQFAVYERIAQTSQTE
jgi:hypothetical protein